MTEQKNMAGGGNGNELRQPFKHAEQERFRDGLFGHATLRLACLSRSPSHPIALDEESGRPEDYRSGSEKARAFVEWFQMLTLFHHPLYASCRFVRLALGEYGEELQLIEEQPWVRRKEFLALNPAGTIPVLLAEG